MPSGRSIHIFIPADRLEQVVEQRVRTYYKVVHMSTANLFFLETVQNVGILQLTFSYDYIKRRLHFAFLLEDVTNDRVPFNRQSLLLS